jgi:lipopolysaccharide/colanic/teichoic acid biosynthesis glycosyltransferase
LWEDLIMGADAGLAMRSDRIDDSTAVSQPFAKRATDVVVAALLLIFASPLIALVAVAIVVDSRGPVVFRCRRVGLGGRHFDMLKFRKMRDGADGPPLTDLADERFTRVGAFLARTKLDELPQLVNVLRGEMSLVGPRPEDPAFVELFPEEFSEVLSVRPGMTGLSQLAFASESRILARPHLNGRYADALLPSKLELDRLYVRRHSVALDWRILMWTAAAVAVRRDVAVDRATGRLSVRRLETVAADATPRWRD